MGKHTDVLFGAVLCKGASDEVISTPVIYYPCLPGRQ